MAVTYVAVRTVTAGIHCHWLLEPIGPNDNQCDLAWWSSTADRNGAQHQQNYLVSTCLSSQEDEPGDGRVAAVEPVDSDEEEAEDEDVDNRSTLIQQYFQRHTGKTL
ncbi:hypothetical protein NDU88_003038 [Pleurodeles waltl]|uniref:Uncharacterized protein n=1 Tax=Pleurodeles waltl TaxID=8319 RepID=A0AAV7W106_PLEWA|nr:hypothetical protein NDU88_003038 [Pleurodeles waltl]